VSRAALYAAPAMFFALPSLAQADDQEASGAADLRTVLFGSLDAGHSTFGTVGVKRTLLGSLDRSGPLGMASLGYGGTAERAWSEAGETRLRRHALQASALLGYQWVSDGIVIAALAGPEIEGEHVSRRVMPDVSDAHFGLRLHGEIWAHPTTHTLLTTTVIVGTARTRIYGAGLRRVTPCGTASSSARRFRSTLPTRTGSGASARILPG
jgi:hypothetical protein